MSALLKNFINYTIYATSYLGPTSWGLITVCTLFFLLLLLLFIIYTLKYFYCLLYILFNSLNITGITIFFFGWREGNNFLLLNSAKVNLSGQAWYLWKSMNFPNKAVVEIPCVLVTIHILVLVAARVFDVLNFVFPCQAFLQKTREPLWRLGLVLLLVLPLWLFSKQLETSYSPVITSFSPAWQDRVSR